MNIHIHGIPARLEVTAFSHSRDNRRGHIDEWLPDDPPEIEWRVLDRKGRPAPWLEKQLSAAERASLEEALIAQCTSRDEEIF
jgi:hypothetical protein